MASEQEWEKGAIWPNPSGMMAQLKIGTFHLGMPEWLVDTILRDHQLAHRYDLSADMEWLEEQHNSLKSAEARIAELEVELALARRP